MAQNTSSAAYLQLKPLTNTNIGAIVEENIRYWKQTRDAEEAEKLANEARQAEYMRKVRKDRKDETTALTVGEAQGKFRNQRVNLYNQVAPEYAALKQQYAETGDDSLLLKMDGIRSYFDELNSITKNVEAYSTYLAENKDKDYNPILDEGKKERFKKLTSGQYTLDKNKGFGIPNEKGEITEWISPSRLNEEFSTLMKFSGKANLDEMGTAIATAIKIPKIDGEQRITPNIIKSAKGLVRAELLNNELRLNTIAKTLKKDPSKPLSELDITEITEYAYTEYVDGKMQEVVNPLGIRGKEMDLVNKGLSAEKSRLQIKKDKKLIEEGLSQIELATNESNEMVRLQETVDENGTYKGVRNVIPYTIRGKKPKTSTGNVIDFYVQDEETGDIGYVELLKTQELEVINDKQKLVDRVSPNVVWDDVSVGGQAVNIELPNGKKINNVSELKQTFADIKRSSLGTSDSDNGILD